MTGLSKFFVEVEKNTDAIPSVPAGGNIIKMTTYDGNLTLLDYVTGQVRQYWDSTAVTTAISAAIAALPEDKGIVNSSFITSTSSFIAQKTGTHIVHIVGGGGDGGAGYGTSGGGGGGGGSGECRVVTVNLIKNNSYPVVIGQHTQSTSFNGVVAAAGQNGNAGGAYLGGRGGNGQNPGTNGQSRDPYDGYDFNDKGGNGGSGGGGFFPDGTGMAATGGFNATSNQGTVFGGNGGSGYGAGGGGTAGGQSGAGGFGSQGCVYIIW